MKLWCRCFGIELGNGCKFFGRARLRRFHHGKIKIGDNCRFDSLKDKNHIGLYRPCQFTALPGATVSIGNNSGFGGTIIRSAISITIGNNVKAGANCVILDHEGHPEDHRSGPPKAVVIEDDVWLGTNVLVLKGVNIGKNTIIAANSVVTKDIPANSVAGGVPCRIIKALPT